MHLIIQKTEEIHVEIPKAINVEIKEPIDVEKEIDGKVKSEYVDFFGVTSFDHSVVNHLFEFMDVAKSRGYFMKTRMYSKYLFCWHERIQFLSKNSRISFL